MQAGNRLQDIGHREQVTAGWDVRARRNDDNLTADGRKRGQRLLHTRF